MAERSMIERLAYASSGLSITRSAWSTTRAPEPADLIQFAIYGRRGGLKGEATMSPEAARYYHDKLSDLLGAPRADWSALLGGLEDGGARG